MDQIMEMLNLYRQHKCISCGEDIKVNSVPCHGRRMVCHRCNYSLKNKPRRPGSKYTRTY